LGFFIKVCLFYNYLFLFFSNFFILFFSNFFILFFSNFFYFIFFKLGLFFLIYFEKNIFFKEKFNQRVFRVKSCNNCFYKYYVVFLVKKDLDDKSMDLFINYYSSLRLIDQITFLKVLEEDLKSQKK
jgi:hypothetical protein